MTTTRRAAFCAPSKAWREERRPALITEVKKASPSKADPPRLRSPRLSPAPTRRAARPAFRS